MTGTLITAICGLGIGIASLGWQIWAHFWDRRARVKVRAMIAVNLDNPVVPPQLLLRVVNVSKVPVTWSGWAIATNKTSKGGLEICPATPGLPKRLLENEEHGVHIPVDTLDGTLARVCAWGTSGKNWQVGKKQIVDLNRSIENLKTKTKGQASGYTAPSE